MKSDFAILDVKAGRRTLAAHFKNVPRLGPCPDDLRIPVSITGYLTGQWGGDDGTSIEFCVDVVSVAAGKPGASL